MSDEMPLAVIEVEGIPAGPNARGMGLRARLREKMRYRDEVAWRCRAYWRLIPTPLHRARVVVTLIRAGGLARDRDNAYASAKHCIDGLLPCAGGRLVVDDDEAHMDVEVRQEVGCRRAVRIEIWDAYALDGARGDVPGGDVD